MRSVDVPDISYDEDRVLNDHMMKGREELISSLSLCCEIQTLCIHRGKSCPAIFNPTCPERAKNIKHN